MRITYKGLVKRGSRGQHVKELQVVLNKLGYNCGTPDGIAGIKTETAIKNIQSDNKLVTDGIAGQATYNKINELLSGKVDNKPINKSTQSANKSKYYKKGNVHIIETIPDNVEVKILGNNLHNADVYGMNGTFYNMKEYNQPRACWAIATNNGKPIGGNSMLNNYSKIARGTIIYYKDGTMEVKRIVGTNEIKKPHVWAMGGYSIYPYFNLNAEKCPSAINYKTAHSYIAYKIVDGKPKIYLFVKPNHMIKDILPFVKEMKFDGCVVVDGGGSSQIRHPNGKYGSNRKVNNVILLKEV